jgi:hypothetical protein
MAAGDSMIMFGVLFLVGLLFVGFLILAAALAAKPETRTAGLWMLGVTFFVAVALPLSWFFASSAAPQQTVWIQDGSGRMVPTVQQTAQLSPLVSMFGILFLFVVIAGMIAMLANQRTRKAGLVIVGAGLVFLIGYLFIGSASLHVKSPAPPVAVQKATTADGRTITPPIMEERHLIPVEQGMAKAPEQEQVTPPRDVNASDPVASEPSTAAPPVTPPVAPSAGPATEKPAPATNPPPSAPPANPIGPRDVADGSKASPSSGRYVPPEFASSNYPLQTGDKDSLPEWAKQGGGIAPDGTYFTVVRCGPFLRFDDCWNDLRLKVDEAAISYRIHNSVGGGYRPTSRPLSEPLRKQLMAEKFLEIGDSSVGNTMTLYVRVAFTQEATAAMRAWQADLLAQNRTMFTTIVGGLLVGLIAVAYGYFRVDTATLGYYTWRLRFVALFFVIGITISGIAAGAVFFEEESRLGGINF